MEELLIGIKDLNLCIIRIKTEKRRESCKGVYYFIEN